MPLLLVEFCWLYARATGDRNKMSITKQNLNAIINLFQFKKLPGTGQQANSLELETILQKSDQLHSEISEQREVIRKMFNN